MAAALPTYADRSKWTIHALWFLLVPIILYEAWAVFKAPGIGAPSLVAHSVISKFFHQFGFTFAFMPGLVAVVSLLAIHIAENIRKENRHRLWTPPEHALYLVMLAESLAWAVPLYIVGAVSSHLLAQGALDPSLPPSLAAQVIDRAGGARDLWVQGMMLSLGAGIFEELVFRLLGLNLFHFITSALFGKESTLGTAAAMAVTALLFAAAHFIGRPFDSSVVFYFFGGVYFAVIYLWRGFGIAAGTHVLYDMLVTTAMWRAASQG